MRIGDHADNSLKLLETALKPFYEETKAFFVNLMKEFVK